MDLLINPAPSPAKGAFANGYETAARQFAEHLENGEEIGAAFTVYHRGQCVIDLWGGMADIEEGRPWKYDTRIVLFSVTKGLAAMAFQLLAERGLFDWDDPVTKYWPSFGRAQKQNMTIATLLEHRGGLAGLDTELTLEQCTNPDSADIILEALEAQRPAWPIGEDQGYHAITWGMYARELFERITGGADLGQFLREEFFEPLNSDIFLGTPESLDDDFATLYPPATPARVAKMLHNALTQRTSTEARVFKQFLSPGSTMRRALLNPSIPGDDITQYNRPPARRSVLAWASATGSARGVARAYLPFSLRGSFDGRTYLKPETLEPLYFRQSWSDNDRVMQKPLGWSRGFCKDERFYFSPNPQSFGHPGMGGALGWADPVEEIAIGYAMNRMDWRVRSRRASALCRALYESEALVPRNTGVLDR